MKYRILIDSLTPHCIHVMKKEEKSFIIRTSVILVLSESTIY